jgi:hypothetical protein
MARIVLTNVQVVVGGVDLSNHVASVTLGSTYDVLETTAFAGGNVPAAAKTRTAGLVDNSVTLEFHQDFADPGAGNTPVEQTIYPLLGLETSIEVQPVTSATQGPTNPKYTFQAVVSEWTPLNGAVGELATASVTWPITGAILKTV